MSDAMRKMQMLEQLAEILIAAKPEWDVEVCPEPALCFLTIITPDGEFDLSLTDELEGDAA